MARRVLENEGHDFEEPFDKDFWLQVEEKFNSGRGISWNRAMDEVRTERLMAKHGKDTLLVIIRDWPASEKCKNKLELVGNLEYLISRFTEIILERDRDEEYRYYFVMDDPACPTLLHLAVEQNFIRVAKLLVEKYPSLIYTKSRRVGEKREYLPVEKALLMYNDATAAYLISQMKPGRVCELFLSKDDWKEATFSFSHFISHRNQETGKHDMKKTVIAVLNCLVIPYWPYLPEKFEELQMGDISDCIGRAWGSVPDDPKNYDFFYHLLDADDKGRQPKLDEFVINEHFNQNSVSCLRYIAESKDKDAIQHPVVRMLVSRKWNMFGYWWFCTQASLYVVFLIVLSYAIIHGSTQDDPTQYGGKANGLRLFCEVVSIIFLTCYLLKEVDQAEREWRTYFMDPYNYFDWLGLILTFLVIPLRFAEIDFQWSVAGVGYLFNFLRLFKFSCLSSTTGLYTKTLTKVVYRDMSRFSIVFVIVFLGFCGALFMALKAMAKQDMFLNYTWLMLASVRALVEQQPVEHDYSKFDNTAWKAHRSNYSLIENDHLANWSLEKDCCCRLTFRQPARKPSSESLQLDCACPTLYNVLCTNLGCVPVDESHFTLKMASAQIVETSVANNSPPQDSSHPDDHFQSSWLTVLIILSYMAMVIVILLNVLIAQLSYTYSEAKSNAKLQYAIDRIVIVTRIEYSRFARFNLRVRSYLEGERVSERTLAEEILEYSDERDPWESIEEKLNNIRDMMRKVLRKKPENSEQNNAEEKESYKALQPQTSRFG